MKKYFYIVSFSFLGFLTQFLVHGLLEWAYVLLLRRDYAFWSFGASYDTLWQVHHAMSVGLMGAGVFFGFMMGRFFWPILYDETGNVRKEVKARWNLK